MSFLLPRTDWLGREKLLRQGVASDPGWPITNAFLSFMLAETGRLQEAAGYMQKAAAADLRLTNWQPYNARLQCGSGQFEPAISDLVAELKRNPEDNDIGYGLRGCLRYARRWADLRALAMTSATTNSANRTDPTSPIYDVYLVAEESGKPADIARARSAALAAPTAKPGSVAPAIETLFALGFPDDAFAMADRYTPIGDSAFLFFTFTAPLRKDPRFMQLAARIGLVDYWRSSGHWPDFCDDPALPYNCRLEAEKLKPAK